VRPGLSSRSAIRRRAWRPSSTPVTFPRNSSSIHGIFSLSEQKNCYGRAVTHPDDTNWTSLPVRTHVYKLQLSSEAKVCLKAEAQTQAGKKAGQDVTLKITGASPKDGGELQYPIRRRVVLDLTLPPITIMHDLPRRPVPTKTKAIEEAHLYISPAYTIEKGNHSIVYEAEWELPCSVVIPPPPIKPVLCVECVKVAVTRILKEKKGKHNERIDLGPIRTNVVWQDPMCPTCKHIVPPEPEPPTVKVRVVAKLSNERDEHLARESKNYQRFERHMFEDRSGLNVLLPVLVGALVPRLYGYYVPEEDERVVSMENKDDNPTNEWIGEDSMIADGNGDDANQTEAHSSKGTKAGKDGRKQMKGDF